MSAYRMGAIGFWSLHMRDKEKYIKYSEGAINTLKEIDKHTKHQYSDAINEPILAFEFEKFVVKADTHKIKSKKYISYYKQMSFINKVKVYLKSFFLRTYKFFSTRK